MASSEVHALKSRILQTAEQALSVDDEDRRDAVLDCIAKVPLPGSPMEYGFQVLRALEDCRQDSIDIRRNIAELLADERLLLGQHPYEQSQPAVRLWALLAVSGLGMSLLIEPGTPWVWSYAVLLLIGVVFSRLTVRIDDETISWHFGRAYFRTTLELSTLRRCEVHSLKGIGPAWGVWPMAGGRSWRAQGREGVMLEDHGGCRYWISSDDPHRLRHALIKRPENMPSSV